MRAEHRGDRWGSGLADAPQPRPRPPEELALLQAAADRRVFVHFDNQARRERRPHINLLTTQCGVTLGLQSFRDCGDALRWFTAGEVRR